MNKNAFDREAENEGKNLKCMREYTTPDKFIKTKHYRKFYQNSNMNLNELWDYQLKQTIQKEME